MKKANRAYIENNKKQKYALNKTSKLFSFTSTLKLTIALALFLMAALFINAGNVIVENGALNVSNSLTVNTSTLFVDSANNRVGIGTTSPLGMLEVETTSDSVMAFFTQIGSTAGSPPTISFNKARAGTTIVQSGDRVGQITFRAFDGTAYRNAAQIRVEVDTTPGSSDMPGRLTFFTTPDGSSTISERLRITSAGNVGIGTTSPNQKLMVAGNANITGTVYYGALQANSPVLERTAEPFVAKCTIADDGKLVVEYIHNEAGAYSRVIEAVNSDSSSWYHRSCFEKNEKFNYLDSLLSSGIKVEEIIADENGNQAATQKDPNIEDIGFDWNTKTAYLIE